MASSIKMILSFSSLSCIVSAKRIEAQYFATIEKSESEGKQTDSFRYEYYIE